LFLLPIFCRRHLLTVARRSAMNIDNNVRMKRILLSMILSVAATCAMAQAWPSRPVRLLLPYTPGGGVDVVGRSMAVKLTELSGVTVVVENRPGGTGVIATELLARAAPDGQTLMASALEFAINPALRKLPYDPLKDFTHLTQLASVQMMLAAHPSVPLRTSRQVIEAMKARPERLTFGSSGTGGGPHLAGELFQMMSGARWTHVPFKGASPAAIAVMSGEVDFSFGSTNALMDHARNGKVRAIGVTGARRFAQLPDVPTIAESGIPGYLAIGWYGLYGPGNMPPDLVKRIYAETTRALTSADVKERLERTGNEIVMSAPEDFGMFLRAEIAKWGKVVSASGQKFE
jgi:tripartite-type tricarboxylate transporter receptor subunit TctC